MKIGLKLLFIAVMISVNFLMAQDVLDYGIKLGVSSSKVKATDTKTSFYSNTPEYYEGNSVNPFIGIYLNYKLSDNLSLESELTYLQKGSRKTMDLIYTTIDNPSGNEQSTKYTTEIDLRYLELGLNLKPTVCLGKVPAYLILGASANYTLNAINITQDKIQDFLFSYKLGVGCNISGILNKPLAVEVKYIGDFSKFYSYDYGNLWNQVILVNIGININ